MYRVTLISKKVGRWTTFVYAQHFSDAIEIAMQKAPRDDGPWEPLYCN